MVSNGRLLEERCQEALLIGERLLHLVQSTLAEAELDEVERLLDRREVLVGEVTGLVGTPPGQGALPLLERLAEQQRSLEAKMMQAMAAVRLENAETQSARAQVQGLGRLLQKDTGPRLLDERR